MRERNARGGPESISRRRVLGGALELAVDLGRRRDQLVVQVAAAQRIREHFQLAIIRAVRGRGKLVPMAAFARFWRKCRIARMQLEGIKH